MKRAWMAALILAACIAFGQSQPPTPAKVESSAQHQSQSSPKQDSSADHPSISRPAIAKTNIASAASSNQTSEDRSKNDSNKTPKHWWTDTNWLTVVIAGLALIVGIAQFVMFICQLRAMNKGLRSSTIAARQAIKASSIARRQYEADHRPWVSITVALNGGLTWDVNGLVIPLVIILENVGNSPAVFMMYPSAMPQNYEFTNVQRILNECESIDTIQQFANVLFPGKQYIQGYQTPISYEQIRESLERDKIQFNRTEVLNILIPMIVACVGYKTPLGSRIFHTGEVYVIHKRKPENPGVRIALILDNDRVPISAEELILEQDWQCGYAD